MLAEKWRSINPGSDVDAKFIVPPYLPRLTQSGTGAASAMATGVAIRSNISST